MAGLIIIPEDLRGRHIAPFNEFLFKVSESASAPIMHMTNEKIPTDIDWLITYGLPQHNRQTVMTEQILALPEDIPIIGWVQDLQTYGLEYTKREQEALFDRFNTIITYRKYDFINRFPQHEWKHEWIPNWLYNTDLYEQLPFNENPIPQFTLSGNSFPEVYPFRASMERIGHPDIIRFGTFTYNAVQYAKIMNMYIGGITCPSIYGVALKKHFEIPGAGGLLVTPGCQELNDLGFIHNEHYINTMDCKLSPDNLIENFIRRPEICREIRLNGMNFVRKYHSTEQRYQEFAAILNRTLSLEIG